MYKKSIYNCEIFGGNGFGSLREGTGTEGGKELFCEAPEIAFGGQFPVVK